MSGVITYSPCKMEKENDMSPYRDNGFDLTFTKTEDLLTSIHQLSQSFDNREPLSPSKIKLHNNHASESSIMTFSPNKKDVNYHSISSKSSLSPTKFEKFVKMDPEMMANPFRAKKIDSVKFQIKNSITYMERANVPKVSENVE